MDFVKVHPRCGIFTALDLDCIRALALEGRIQLSDGEKAVNHDGRLFWDRISSLSFFEALELFQTIRWRETDIAEETL